MKTKFLQMACCITAAALILSCVAPAASAQRTSSSFTQAWTGYNNTFLYTDSQGNDQIRNNTNETKPTSFWNSANFIDMAVQAYNWAEANDPSLAPSIKTEINSLCNGFRDTNGDNWSSNSYDDDLMWATIAFAEAYNITGNSQQLTDAENAFNLVYSRGYDTTFGGGIWWNSACEASCSGSKVSASNWTFVIAGHLLHAATGVSTYDTEAASVYSWAKANLFDPTTGEIYDGISTRGHGSSTYTYDFGIAIGAMSDSAESNSTIGQVADYLFNGLTNYAGTTLNGFNILPNYGGSGSDGAGFNGIALKWLAFANSRGQIPALDMAAAEANVDQGWTERTSKNVAWQDWDATTTESPLWGWDCGDIVFGMAGIPVSPATGTHSILNLKTGHAVDDDNVTTSGSGVVQWAPNGGTTQKWIFSQNSDTSWTITSQQSGNVLDDPGGSAVAGEQMVQHSADTASNQKWIVTPLADGSNEIMNESSGQVLDGSSSTVNGYALEQYTLNGQTQQQWNIQ
jgi:predicted alpha-1,6-mannanase (GH76 family)